MSIFGIFFLDGELRIKPKMDAASLKYTQNVAFNPPNVTSSIPSFYVDNQSCEFSAYSNLFSTFPIIATNASLFPNIQTTYPLSFSGSTSAPRLDAVGDAGHVGLTDLLPAAVAEFNSEDFCDMVSFPSGLDDIVPFTGQELVLDLIGQEFDDSIGNIQQQCDDGKYKYFNEEIGRASCRERV